MKTRIINLNPFDYLAIGVVTRDLVKDGWTIGGTVSFSGRTAVALDCRTAIVTSTTPDFAFDILLPDIIVHNVPASATTTFSNIYTSNGRQQIVHSVAKNITFDDIPDTWRESAIIHLGPLVGEVDSKMATCFPHSLVGLTPQGWLRGWDEQGYVFAREWACAKATLSQADVVILSEEDLLNAGMLQQYREWSPLLVLTEGVNGCTVFLDNEVWQMPAESVTAKELTGAGDIFAAAFLVQFQRNGRDAINAAEFANKIAAASVTQISLAAKVTAISKSRLWQAA